MAQFDLFVNPVTAIRRAYPFVVVLQYDFAPGARDLVIAPLAPTQSMPKVAGRLTPIVSLDGVMHTVLVHALTGMPARDLREFKGSIADARGDLLAAIDYLFFGV